MKCLLMLQEGPKDGNAFSPGKDGKQAALGKLKSTVFLCASVHSWVSLQTSFLCSFACVGDVAAHVEK